MEPNSSEQNSMIIPIAIILGFALIALAVFFTANRNPVSPSTNVQGEEIVETGTPRPVDSTDYVRGNPNAPILVIEYSDYDCPFCKQYHSVLNQIMDEYGITGRVAWVYRQFPLAQLHPNAPTVSEAALCVGKIGGQNSFWTFTDLIFDKREINEQTNIVALPEYAESAGVDLAAYNSCMQSGEMKSAVDASVEEALSIGARGTPYTVLVVGNQQAVINGAQPYETVKGIIENLLLQLTGPEGTTLVPAPAATSTDL